VVPIVDIDTIVVDFTTCDVNAKPNAHTNFIIVMLLMLYLFHTLIFTRAGQNKPNCIALPKIALN